MDPWAESRGGPGVLGGYRVLVTRAQAQGSGLRDRLVALGARVLLLPVIEIVPPESFVALDAALHELARFDWVVLTSANAADAMAARLPPGAAVQRLAVIGAATLARVRELGLPEPMAEPTLVPEAAVAESLVEALEPRVLALLGGQGSARVLLLRAERAREMLPERLRAMGVEVAVVAAYRNRVPARSIPVLRALLGRREWWPDAIPFTSSSSVTNLLALLEAGGVSLPEEIARVSIGPITSATLRESGLPPTAEAETATVQGLVDAIAEVARRAG